MKLKLMGITLAITFSLLLTGCGSASEGSENAGEENTNIGEEVDYTIIGIEPGSGTMELANNALEEYENLQGWELLEGSSAGMLTELDQAISNEEPIVVTGWNPHWMFASYDIKYLEDPKGSFGETENIHTIARTGLEEDNPNAYNILDRFQWESEDMEVVMLEGQDTSFEEAANTWIEENQDQVAEWTEGIEKANGEEIELVTTQWESELASAAVIKQVLEQHGYVVKVTPVDPAVLFQVVAEGSADASIAPWLPITHGSFYEQYKEDIVDLGENLSGAKIGIVVPEYMDIDSIEDLPPKE